MRWTHKAQRGGRGCLGWSAAVRGRAMISGSAGSDNASGPCSVCFLSLWTQRGKHVVTASKQLKKIRLADMSSSQEWKRRCYNSQRSVKRPRSLAPTKRNTQVYPATTAKLDAECIAMNCTLAIVTQRGSWLQTLPLQPARASQN